MIYTTTQGNYLSLLDPSHAITHGLPTEALIGEVLVIEPGVNAVRPDNIRVNRVFVDFMHRVIAQYAPTLPDFQAGARHQHEGWLYILDARTPTPQGEVPPEDILGAFEVRQGRVVPGSYQPSSKHQIVSERGLVRLSSELRDCLLFELDRLTTA